MLIPQSKIEFTIVSIVPFLIREEKKSLYPGYFEIQPVPKGDIGLLYVGESSSPIEIPLSEERTVVMSRFSPDIICQSIIGDYTSSLMLTNESCYPGLFYVPKKVDKPTVRKEFAKELEDIILAQSLWFQKLVTDADDEWAKRSQFRFVADMQRIACRWLGLERPWLVEKIEDIKFCPACATKVPPAAVVCSKCNAILDEEKYSKIKFAGKV